MEQKMGLLLVTIVDKTELQGAQICFCQTLEKSLETNVKMG